MNKKNGEASMTLTLVLAIIIFILGLTAYYFYNKYQQAQRIVNNPSELGKRETDQLVAKVGKLITLPKSETPTVATVSDVSKIKNQPFFKNAANGDKLLIYTTASKAILYRPSTNIIIETAPVNVGQGQVQPTVEPSVIPSVSPAPKS